MSINNIDISNTDYSIKKHTGKAVWGWSWNLDINSPGSIINWLRWPWEGHFYRSHVFHAQKELGGPLCGKTSKTHSRSNHLTYYSAQFSLWLPWFIFNSRDLSVFSISTALLKVTIWHWQQYVVLEYVISCVIFSSDRPVWGLYGHKLGDRKFVQFIRFNLLIYFTHEETGPLYCLRSHR